MLLNTLKEVIIKGGFNMNPNRMFQESEKFINEGKDKEAENLLQKLTKFETIKDVAFYRLGEIYNRSGNPTEAYKYHKKAFDANSTLTSRITAKDHPNASFDYEVGHEEEEDIKDCPLCRKGAEPHSVYNVSTDYGFVKGFNPIRLWMYCESCHHIFASNYPKKLGDVLSCDSHSVFIEPRVQFIPNLNNIIHELKKIANGNHYLEIGVGAGEMIAVAKEHGFDVEGLDIRPNYAKQVSNIIDSPVHSVDFSKFKSGKQYDVIVMGDVIEHVTDPIAMLKKASDLLTDDGVMWISTPNFDSAFSLIRKEKDPMWSVCQHINYFSKVSLENLMKELGFEAIDYKNSSRFNGSMEVMFRKK